MNYYLLRSAIIMTSAIALALAGPNKNAAFFIDLSPTSAGIDSVGSCLKDSVFTAGVFVHDAKNLYDYECYIAYDTAQLQFVKAEKGSNNCINLLESKGASSIYFNGQKSADSCHVLVGGTLTGSSSCVDSGSGCLGLVTFRKRTGDTTLLSLSRTILEGCGDAPVSDTGCVTHKAKVVLATIGVKAQFKIFQVREKIEYINGTVRVVMPSGSEDVKAIISDVSGREIRRFSRGTTLMEADMKSAARGIYFISIAHGAKISSFPFIIGK
jgi:hypothetical protein